MDAKSQPSDRSSATLRCILAGLAAVWFVAVSAVAQDICVTTERMQELKSGVESAKGAAVNEVLKAEILKMVADRQAQTSPPVSLVRKPPEPVVPKEEFAARARERICAILRTEPWPIAGTVGPEAASAWVNLVRNYFSYDFQRSVLPIISAGVDRSEIRKDAEIATLIDRLRLVSGLPQLFGTQAVSSDGFLVLSPLLSDEKVDDWRKEYGLNSLRDYIRALELNFRMPLIRSTARPSRVEVNADPQKPPPAETGSDLLKSDLDDETVRVDTSLVTIDAVVYGPAMQKLERGDFKIFEDGKEQDISVFAASESPFDIVLLLDLSGSTADKVGLIRRTAKRFVEMKREVDRVAIAIFTGGQTVVSPLEQDRKKLLDSVSKIKGYGSSHVWDAVNFAFAMLKQSSPGNRRKAVVLMSDGVDNALLGSPGLGSKTLFAETIEAIRSSQIAVFPIYLDTESSTREDPRAYENARRALRLMADESGGSYYAAKEIENLNQVYELVLKDIGRVYSLGYEPTNPKRDGAWRSIKVEVPGTPEIKVRARPGYYAR